MYTLATLHHLRQRLGLAAADTADDARLLHALQAASSAIERATGRRFAPRRAALPHTVTHPLELLLEDDLLELTSVTNGDGQPIAGSSLIALPSQPPFVALRLIAGSFVWLTTPAQAITVSGVWGWHDRPALLWLNSLDTVQNNPLTATATSLTATAAAAANANAESPRFQVGHLLKIESEYLRVTTISGNTLTVQRGVNGSSAASHALNTPIFTHQPPAAVQALTLRWAHWLYREADATAPVPAALLDELAALRRPRVA